MRHSRVTKFYLPHGSSRVTKKVTEYRYLDGVTSSIQDQLDAGGGGGSGDVVGPSSATDNALVTFDGTTGKLIQDDTGIVVTGGSTTPTMTFPDNSFIAVTWFLDPKNGRELLKLDGNSGSDDDYLTIHAVDTPNALTTGVTIGVEGTDTNVDLSLAAKGTGNINLNSNVDSPTLLTPTIASFVNATHDHSNDANGGLLGMQPITFTPQMAVLDDTLYPQFDYRNGRLVLDFVINEIAYFTNCLGSSYAGGGLTLDVYFMMTSATSGTVIWSVAIEALIAGEDYDSDSFATAQTHTETVPSASGWMDKASITFTDGAQMDSLTAGNPFRLKLKHGGGTAAGDAEFMLAVLRET